MKSGELIINRDEFSTLSGECEKIIDTQKRLPDFVFRRPFPKYFAIEYNDVYTEEFGSFLFKLSNIFKDKSVNYMILDPHPVDCYYPRHSFFGLASFEPSSLVEKYSYIKSRMSDELGISDLLPGVNVGVFWGSSLKWGIMCDRISWEMAVIAVSENVDVPTISGFRCLDASQITSYIKGAYSWKPSAALDFNQRFFANYPI
jgi:hypothetical protein